LVGGIDPQHLFQCRSSGRWISQAIEKLREGEENIHRRRRPAKQLKINHRRFLVPLLVAIAVGKQLEGTPIARAQHENPAQDGLGFGGLPKFTV
jgi:hypothetical protein